MSITTAFNHIKRDMGIKRCVIIDGNVSDVYLDGAIARTLEEYLGIILNKQLGYENIILWDKVSGCKNLKGSTDNLNIVDEADIEGEDYSVDDDNDTSSDTQLPDLKETKEILNVVLKNMPNQQKKMAFILNWSDYLFSAGSLSDSDREYLTILGKAIREPKRVAQTPNSNGNDLNENVIIIITNKLSLIPLSLYQANPEVSCINIPKPDRTERKDLLIQIEDSFNIRLPKSSDKITTCENASQYVDMLDDFTNREIIQMARLSYKAELLEERRLTFDELYFLFRYGEKDNPWEKLDYSSVKRIDKILAERVVGQEEAIEKIKKTVIKAYMGLTGIHKTSSRSMPKGVFFFVGPTGVGKTELSKALAHFLFGDEQACIRFDMSEYAQENSDQKLIGAPPGYVGYEEGGQLTNAIREKPFSIILFDEIEKAAERNPRILDIFLQILEDGRLTDSKGETVYFSESIIIFTSNLGASEIVFEASKSKEEIAAEFEEKVKAYFNTTIKRPEILGRIGYNNIVPFNFINDTDFSKKIVRSKIKPICKGIKDKFKIDLAFSNEEDFVKYILDFADVNKGGRDILNSINDHLLDALALHLFEYKQDLREYRDSKLIVTVNKKTNNLEFDFE